MEFEILAKLLASLNSMAMLDAGCWMLNILGDTLSEVEIDTLVEILVKRQARVQVK